MNNFIRAGDKKFIYGFTAYMTETIWYNTTLVKPEEVSSWDNLLDPKWKGKIAILDPRTPGSGESTWAFLWRIKGESYLAKLAAQDMLVGRNLRQLGENVARGKSAISIGLSYYTYLPFIKAGLPVKPRRSKRATTAHPAAAMSFCSRIRLIPIQGVFELVVV